MKPMLAIDCGDVDSVVFPVIVSPKLDGVRAIISKGSVFSRTLKLIPNHNVQALLGNLPEGLDGELLTGDPCAPDVYRKTVSMVMSETAEIEGLVYHVFDIQEAGTFAERFLHLVSIFGGLENRDALELVPQTQIENASRLSELETDYVEIGYEGVILRATHGPYKHGRSTVREGYLLKLKRFVDSEAEVIGVTELMHNGNEAKTNELGRTARSTHKANKTGMGVLGALSVRDVKTGVEFEIGTGFSARERGQLWADETNAPTTYKCVDEDGSSIDVPVLPSGTATVGRLAKYKYFAGGSKDKPRFPVFLGWRNLLDM